MRLFALTLCLLMTATVASGASGPSSGWGAGTVEEGGRDVRVHSTHGDQPCLSIYIPKAYTITVSHAPGDVLGLTAQGQTALTENGVASLSFTANYCTQFSFWIDGVDVDGEAAYAVTVTSVHKAPVALA